MNIGIDIHGCIDKYKIFASWSIKWANQGHIIHIITGQEWKSVQHKVIQAGVIYHRSFSIVDYHLAHKTKMWKKNKTWWMDNKTWLMSKGLYCKREGIDIHFDDSQEYAQYMPETTLFILVPKKNFDKTWKSVITSE